MEFLRGPICIGVYTWREGIRKRSYIGFLILSLLVIFGASFITSFMNQRVGGDVGVQTDVDLKLIKDICVTTIAIFGMLITVFISASMVPNEMENKVVYSVLSKPLSRFQYLLGKFIGIQAIILLNLLLMGGLFFAALWLRQGIMPTLLLWSILLTYFEFLIVSAFTFAISCTSTSAVLPTIAGLFIYIVGNLTQYLREVIERAGEAGNALDAMIGNLAWVLYNVLPNLNYFSLRTQIVNSPPNDPPADILIPNLIVYGLLYAVVGFVLAYWVFRRKEL